MSSNDANPTLRHMLCISSRLYVQVARSSATAVGTVALAACAALFYGMWPALVVVVAYSVITGDTMCRDAPSISFVSDAPREYEMYSNIEAAMNEVEPLSFTGIAIAATEGVAILASGALGVSIATVLTAHLVIAGMRGSLKWAYRARRHRFRRR